MLHRHTKLNNKAKRHVTYPNILDYVKDSSIKAHMDSNIIINH